MPQCKYFNLIVYNYCLIFVKILYLYPEVTKRV